MQDPEFQRQAIYERLMSAADGDRNHDALAKMYASWSLGEGALPDWLGLTPEAFRTMMGYHFPGLRFDDARCGSPLPAARGDEIADLATLVRGALAGADVSEGWIADILIAGCLASDHLWQDLGLWSRTDLSALMRRNFPQLAARNVKDMKWKKFLYKQLCDAEGIYTCRAPSCEQCADYAACFGPEE